ncbi:unnamed protein product [Symbiodinium sp. CCMP2456]|nr:unnamed protein product [Symbiodinium sp. CCMP2456]
MVVTSDMAMSAHAGTSTSLPGSVTFADAIIPTPTLKSRCRTKKYKKDQEPHDDEEVDVESTAGLTKRELVHMKALVHISDWLRLYNFWDLDVNEQQVTSPSGCFLFRRPESMRPIHVAAKLGHERIVKCLLLARADPKTKTSRGRTALQIARKANKEGSHRETVEVLEAAETTVSVRGAIEMMCI